MQKLGKSYSTVPSPILAPDSRETLRFAETVLYTVRVRINTDNSANRREWSRAVGKLCLQVKATDIDGYHHKRRVAMVTYFQVKGTMRALAALHTAYSQGKTPWLEEFQWYDIKPYHGVGRMEPVYPGPRPGRAIHREPRQPFFTPPEYHQTASVR